MSNYEKVLKNNYNKENNILVFNFMIKKYVKMFERIHGISLFPFKKNLTFCSLLFSCIFFLHTFPDQTLSKGYCRIIPSPSPLLVIFNSPKF